MNTRRIYGIAAGLLLAGAAVVMAANEITINSYMRVINGNFDLTRNIQGLAISQGAQFSSYNVQAVVTGAVPTLVTITGGVTTNGMAFFRNLTTNTTRWVEIGVTDTNATFIPLMKLKAGEPSLSRIAAGTNVWALAYGGTVNLEAWIAQD